VKIIGIIGGIGPESTVDYYKLLVAAYLERRTDDSYPQIVINSVDMRRLVGIMNADDLVQLVEWFSAELSKLADAGAQIGLLASNTPHIVFDALSRRSLIPLVSIVEATANRACDLRLTKLALFGSGFTMKASFYPAVFAKHGIELIMPTPQEQAWIHEHYMEELVHGIFKSETRERFVAIASRMQGDSGIQGLILGGTELPLLLRDTDCAMPLLDTTKIHVEAAMKAAWEPPSVIPKSAG
jgi:aspartate racemase